MASIGLTARLVFAATWLLPLAARAAGHHQICYQLAPTLGQTNVGAFQCRSDDPAIGCSISVPGTTLWSSSSTANSASSTVIFPSQGTFVGQVQFTDGVSRNCTIDIGYVAPNNHTGPVPTLIGYTTDESGLLMTGVWQQASPASSTIAMRELQLPAGFLGVGGGAEGAELPSGMLLVKALHQAAGPPHSWNAWASANVFAQTSPVISYAIGMRIEGLSTTTLESLVAEPHVYSSGGGYSSQPTATVTTPAGTVALGGGFDAALGGLYQFVFSSLPTVKQQCYANGTCEQVITAWTTASTENLVSSPIGAITAQIATLPKQLTIGGNPYYVMSWVTNGVSAVAQHPSVAASGLMGEFALTGVGAFVNWQYYGGAPNLLWKVKPRPDIAGAEAASKDHGIVAPASVSAWAVGIKLVPGYVPPPQSSGKPPKIPPSLPPSIL